MTPSNAREERFPALIGDLDAWAKPGVPLACAECDQKLKVAYPQTKSG